MFAHQKKIRDRLLRADLATLGERFANCQIEEFMLAPEPFGREHELFIRTYEWLGTSGFGSKTVFAARCWGHLGGVVIITEPYQYARLSSALPKKADCLIARGACAGWTPKNLGSRLVMFACRWMVANTSKRAFVAYADPDAGEVGTIYQACNFDFLGRTDATKRYVLIDGSVKTAQYFRSTASILQVLRDADIKIDPHWLKPSGFLDRTVAPRQLVEWAESILWSEVANEHAGTRKGRYCLMLGTDRRETKKLRDGRLYHPKPYPKRG